MKTEVAVLLAVCLVAVDRFHDLMDTVNRQQLQGEWRVVALEADGQALPPEAFERGRLSVWDDQYALKGVPDDCRGSFRLHSGESPKAIDATVAAEDGGDEARAPGIYRLDGDRLLICWRRDGTERPREFATAPGSGLRLLVLERFRGRPHLGLTGSVGLSH
jgi:uncharacterized protein (TIGR03067 family)